MTTETPQLNQAELDTLLGFASDDDIPVPYMKRTRDWYLGLANIRGNLTGVIDLARYMGEAPTVLAPDSRVVTFATGLGFNCALLVSRVLGLRQLGEMESLPSADAPPWCSQQYRDSDGQAWTRLDLSQLVSEARFLQVGL